jgi:uncharacterized protein (TIGR00369 family)
VAGCRREPGRLQSGRRSRGIGGVVYFESAVTKSMRRDENRETYPILTDANKRLVEDIFRRATFIGSLGIELTGLGFGWCETKLEVTSAHLQQHGFVHAGVLMTIADHTCGGAALSTMPDGKDVITVENKVSFLRPAPGLELTCRAEVLRTGKSLVFVEGEVFAVRHGRHVLAAKASSTLAVIPFRAAGEVSP